MATPQLINQGILRREIRKIVKEEIKKAYPQNQIHLLWKWLNRLLDRIKCLEIKK